MKLPASSPLVPILADYEVWLNQQLLSIHTRRAYFTQVKQFCVFLNQVDSEYGDPLRDGHARNYAARDYKSYLKTIRKRKPATINIALAAIDNFYRFMHMSPVDVKREDLPQQAPRALTEDEQRRFLRAVERSLSIRDQAIASLLFYTGLRIGECAALNQDDILISARKGKVIVRQGKRDSYREIPLNANVRKTVDAWVINRQEIFPANKHEAFFLNRQGGRLSARAIDMVLRKLSRDADVVLSAHVLRHTCITNLVRKGTDLVLVAEIAGHRRLETTQRYSLPTEEDRREAMESIQVEY